MALNMRALALTGALAGTTIFGAPATAATAPATVLSAPLATFNHSSFDPTDENTAYRRCRGWGCRWGGYRRGWRRSRVDAGDVLIGAAIIGGIAAIASANNRRQREREVVVIERDPRRYDDRRRDDRTAPRTAGSVGLDNAVDLCLDRIERDARVETVDEALRTGAGWQVSGTLFNSAPFQCRIGNSGQIEVIDYGDGFAAQTDAPRGDGQWSDQRYADARLAMGGTVSPDMAISEIAAPDADSPSSASTPMPAYPGGPIPGEVIPETIDGDL